VPSFEFIGSDPIDHFVLGRIEPGDVIDADFQPAGEWKPSRRKRTTDTEHGSDAPDTSKEG